MAWDFVPTELRGQLQPVLDKGEALVSSGLLTRAQAEACVREMLRLGVLVATGVLSKAQGDAAVERYVLRLMLGDVGGDEALGADLGQVS